MAKRQQIRLIKTVLAGCLPGLLLGCSAGSSNDASRETLSELTGSVSLKGKQLARRHCQSCHQFPDPESLNKSTWKQAVLPKMAYRLGLYLDTTRAALVEETRNNQTVVLESTFPKEAQLSLADWKKMEDYYLAHAPDHLSNDSLQPAIQVGLRHFKTRVPSFRADPPMSTLVKIDTGKSLIYLGDTKADYSTVNILSAQGDLIQSVAVQSAPSQIIPTRDDVLHVLTMGRMLPTDIATGKLLRIFKRPMETTYQSFTTTLDKLQRPVHTTFADLNQDGVDDVVVCAFGNYTGRFAWYDGATQEEHVLNPRPGASRAVVEDFDQDGWPDLAVLMAQGDEGIYFYYNQQNGTFREERKLRFPPSYGSTYFELADFNQDGHLDILYTAGDNADYWPILKPYHGVRIFLNDGQQHFEEAKFIPLHGAYKAVARDFDQDGDLDIAAVSFFPDYERTPSEGFVYLENLGNLTFESSTFTQADAGRWITLDAADLDQDGDQDIVLASFAALEVADYKQLNERWIASGPSLMILENTLASVAVP